MADNEATIRALYAAMDRADGAAMAALYAPDATFRDPAFGALTGAQIGDMWTMLTGRSTELTVRLEQAAADGPNGTAHWIATYPFGEAKRPVVNDIRASFTFTPDALIATHEDRFDLRTWASQAMGAVPALLGFTPLLGVMVRRRARGQLDAFRAAR